MHIGPSKWEGRCALLQLLPVRNL